MGALSETKLRALKPGDKDYQRSDGAGLYVCVLPSGTMSFRYEYRMAGRKERVVIGNYPALSLAVARQIHRKFQTMVAQGDSPARSVQMDKERKRGLPGDKFQSFAGSWLAEWGSNKKTDTVDHVRCWLVNDVYPHLGRKNVKEIGSGQILDVLDRIKARGAPQSARRMRGILKQVFDYAINRLLIDVNPVDRIRAASIASVAHRDRVLNRDEIGNFLRGLDASACREQTKIAVKVILLTLVRKQELLRACWEDIDFQARVWRIANTKNRRPLDVFLSRQAVGMFARLKELAGTASPFVLPHMSRVDTPMGSTTLNMAIGRVIGDGNNGLAWFTVHDLRRTGATHLNELGFASDIVERSLNHVTGGVRGIYNRATYADQRRDMLQQWADIVESWIEPKAKVVAIRGSLVTA